MSNGDPNAGAGVDAKGRAVLDPTKNVLDLVTAAILRQDDLRKMQSKHEHAMAKLRAEYDDKLRRAESERINAIRAVDVGAVQQQALVAETRASTLASQVTETAAAFARSLTAALAPIQEAIAALQKAQYETQGGRTQVSESRLDSGGRRQYVGLWIAAAALGASLILGTAGVVITLLLRK